MVVDITGRRLGTVAELQASAAAARSASAAPQTTMMTLQARPFLDCGVAGKPACNRAQAFINASGKRFRDHPQKFAAQMIT
ncbi:MAG: hypothetical protein NVSMB6_21000 [Burkholderiaceae bacterium]